MFESEGVGVARLPPPNLPRSIRHSPHAPWIIAVLAMAPLSAQECRTAEIVCLVAAAAMLSKIIFMLAVLACWPARAHVEPQTSAQDMERRSVALTPGQWVWAPQVSPAGPMLVHVDLDRQRATVFRNGVRIGVTTVSTGKPGYETPVGAFTILQKRAVHRSNRYNNAPMPFMQRLTWDGLALHGGGLPGYPASHGCVRMPLAFARALFAAMPMGASVVIGEGAPPSSRATTAAAPAAPIAIDITAEATPADMFAWAPHLSPAGPVTVVLSGRDQLIVVMRNGVEIGRSALEAPPESDAVTRVLTLARIADGRSEWTSVDGLGAASGALFVLDDAARQRLRIPKAFYETLASVLPPGATLLLTTAPIADITVQSSTAVVTPASSVSAPQAVAQRAYETDIW